MGCARNERCRAVTGRETLSRIESTMSREKSTNINVKHISFIFLEGLLFPSVAKSENYGRDSTSSSSNLLSPISKQVLQLLGTLFDRKQLQIYYTIFCWVHTY